ncbi:DUF2339 domain-containing protein [Dongia deserti]|uniref:DUF2339 domain-containing protein n=1 Tax=Dongia deserti TaxID=2268030 RepID=UPI000E646024|nr:DUF2339 domain-containing protein [Dongia deserti]
MGAQSVVIFESLWGLILVGGAIFFVLVVPALSVLAFRATQRLEREIALLRHELRNLRDRQATADYMPHRPSHPVEEPPQPAPPAPTQPPAPEVPIAPEPAFKAAPSVPPEPTAPDIPLPPAEPEARGLEQRLGARGFVWLGGICIALASFFLVKYSIEEGLLGPGLRVVLGILLGIALLVAGDFMRRKSGTIGQALTAAGIAALYASLFAAVALYQLIAPALAFVILAALTFVAIGLALRHGPFVGLVGLAGGFITPAVVSTGEPHPAILLSYLYLLQLGALWLEGQRAWWYLPAIANAGGLGWAFLVVSLSDAALMGGIDQLAAPVYLIVVAASVFWLSPRVSTETDWPQSRIVGLGSAVAAALLMLLWLSNEGFQAGDWAFVLLLAIVGAVSGRLRPVHEIAAFALASVPALGLLAWNAQFQPAFDPDLYLWMAVIIGALGTGGGYVLLWGARNPERWSLLSAIYGAAVLAIAYWRLRDIDLLLPWSIICLILSAVHLAFAERLRHWRFKDRLHRRAFGVHVLACAGFLAAAVPLWVEREWLPALWSLLMPLIAWVANKIDEPWLRRGLWVAAPAILIAVLDSGFPAGDRPIFNWLAYGLGVPTLCFAATAWLARRASDLRLMLMLQAGALLLGFLLVTLEIRHLFHGAAFKTAAFGFAEAGTLVLLWGVLALGTWRVAQRRGEARLRWIAYGLAALSAVLTVIVVWGFANPLLNPIPVYGLPILNTALYVFGSGFALFMAMAAMVGRSKLDVAQRNTTMGVAAGIALIDGLIGVAALNRHLFQGEIIDLNRGYPLWSDAEFYGYSVAWLIYGGLILALAIWRRLAALRHAAAGIVVLVVFKVFLGDTSGLTGLYRFASFFGLGLTLVALGYLYQRMLRRAEG